MSGAAGAAADVVVESLRAAEGVDAVTVLAPRPRAGAPASSGAPHAEHVVDLVYADLALHVADADVLVHLGAGVDDVDPTQLAPGRLVDEGRAVLAAATAAGVQRVVLVSSTTVYGAWPKNPVPLTEDAVLRPNHGLTLAVECAELERLVADWADDDPGARTATVLRAAPVVADDAPDWLTRALRAALELPVADHDPPTQFLHAQDLASAVVLGVLGGITQVVNVAPDGWLTGGDRRALDSRPRLRLGERVGAAVADARWKLGLAPAPAVLLPYATHPWVVANDRLRAAGWEATTSNEEAYVAAFRAGPWATLSPARRQELALAGAGAGIVGAAFAVGYAALRRRG